jgi:hypothetical protein
LAVRRTPEAPWRPEALPAVSVPRTRETGPEGAQKFLKIFLGRKYSIVVLAVIYFRHSAVHFRFASTLINRFPPSLHAPSQSLAFDTYLLSLPLHQRAEPLLVFLGKQLFWIGHASFGSFSLTLRDHHQFTAPMRFWSVSFKSSGVDQVM